MSLKIRIRAASKLEFDETCKNLNEKFKYIRNLKVGMLVKITQRTSDYGKIGVIEKVDKSDYAVVYGCDHKYCRHQLYILKVPKG